jgi:hypothetical protein
VGSVGLDTGLILCYNQGMKDTGYYQIGTAHRLGGVWKPILQTDSYWYAHFIAWYHGKFVDRDHYVSILVRDPKDGLLDQIAKYPY